MLYPIGSKVVHPFYGAGTVVRIQEKTISDTSHTYYVINTVSRSMQLMVPVGDTHATGLRHVGDVATLRAMLERCCETPQPDEIQRDLRARQEEMREQLKSGRFHQVVDVVRTLFFINSQRPLGTIDRQLFDQGKELLAGELALASGIDLPRALQEVEEALSRMFSAD